MSTSELHKPAPRTAFDAVDAAHDLLASALAAPSREKPERPVAPTVARHALFVLLGDNDNWAEKPQGHDMDVWMAFLRARSNESLMGELSALFPDHALVMQNHMKSWAIEWLRGCATADRLEVVQVGS